jgi:hypothetical protein
MVPPPRLARTRERANLDGTPHPNGSNPARSNQQDGLRCPRRDFRPTGHILPMPNASWILAPILEFLNSTNSSFRTSCLSTSRNSAVTNSRLMGRYRYPLIIDPFSFRRSLQWLLTRRMVTPHPARFSTSMSNRAFLDSSVCEQAVNGSTPS